MPPIPLRRERFAGLALWVAAAILGSASAAPAALPTPAPDRLGSLDDVPVADRFVSPVGDPRDYALPGPGEIRGYQVTRGVHLRHGRHLGLDLSNRESGGEVRAPADGVVIAAKRYGGWGNLVVIAHRLPGGDVVLSLLAHLKPGSIAVKSGDHVVAGQPLATVGRSGHASGPHLHFELRRLGHADPWTFLWENAPALDPLRIMGAKLAEGLTPSRGSGRASSGHWSEPYLLAAFARSSVSASLGDPEAPLSRLEFYEWVEGALANAPARSSASWSNVRKKLVRQGLVDLPKTSRWGKASITAEEADRSLSTLLALDRLPGLPASSRVSRTLLQTRGLPVPAPALASAKEWVLGPTRPLTRGEGALLLASARSWPQAPLAWR